MCIHRTRWAFLLKQSSAKRTNSHTQKMFEAMLNHIWFMHSESEVRVCETRHTFLPIRHTHSSLHLLPSIPFLLDLFLLLLLSWGESVRIAVIQSSCILASKAVLKATVSLHICLRVATRKMLFMPDFDPNLGQGGVADLKLICNSGPQFCLFIFVYFLFIY